VPDRRKHAFDGIGRAQVIPMLSREVVEREQCFAILTARLDRSESGFPRLAGGASLTH